MRRDATRAYVGWHTQAEAFDRAGRLTRGQYVYFGGDVAAARRALDRVAAAGFVVVGGSSDTACAVKSSFGTITIALTLMTDTIVKPREQRAVARAPSGLHPGSAARR